MSKRIVVLGGGIGGIVAANNLRNELPSAVEIILVEQNKTHSFAASYLWLMVNLRKPEKIIIPLNKLVSKGIKILYDEVKLIDTEESKIKTGSEIISYDYLVIALGAELDKKYLQNHSINIHNFYTYEGAQKLRDELSKIQAGEISIVIESLPYKCPGAPYEAAMLISDYITKRGLKDKIIVNLFTPEPHPLPVAGPELGKSVSNLLEQKGIKYFPLHQLNEIDETKKTMTFNSDTIIPYDLPIIIPKHNPPAVLKDSGLTDESGWVPVNRNTLQTNFKNVFAIGDVNSVSLPGKWNDKPMKLPKAGVFAHAQALTVSGIIASEITGKGAAEIFCGDGFCMLEVGEDFAGFAYGDFFAEPHPDVKMKKLGRSWHLGKVLFEKWWLSPLGLNKSIYKSLIQIGGKSLNIPIKL